MFRNLLNNYNSKLQNGKLLLRLRFSTEVTGAITSNSKPKINDNVPGLSGKVVDIPKQPVGPGAAKDKDYKNPEYFCYNVTSFAEAEVEMEKYRLEAPSNKKPFKK